MDNKIFTNRSGKRRFVIADIHGCAQTLMAMVKEQIKLTTEDQLFLLGDYIDRGKDNAGVLDFIMDLIRLGFQVFPLRGNHEEMLLNAWSYYINAKPDSPSEKFSNRIYDAFDLLDGKEELTSKYANFLESLPYFYELDNFYLVHAGFDFKSKYPFADYSSMVWARNFHYNPTSKIVVHGHTVTQLDEIKRKITERHSILPLDNGCYYGLYKGQKFVNGLLEMGVGNLCCLNLDTFELIIQPNID